MAGQSLQLRGVYSPPPRFTASPVINGRAVAPIDAVRPAQAQMTPTQALSTYSAFRRSPDHNVARNLAQISTIRDFSGPTTSGSVAEGLIRMAQAALASRANRDQVEREMQREADAYNDEQSEFDRGVAEKAQAAGQLGAEQGQYSVYGMSKPKPMEVGGRVVDAANNYQELYAPGPKPMSEYETQLMELRRDQAARARPAAPLSPDDLDWGD